MKYGNIKKIDSDVMPVVYIIIFDSSIAMFWYLF